MSNPTAAASDRPRIGLGRLLDLLFNGGLILKGTSAVIEVTGGLLLFFVANAHIRMIVNRITAPDLTEDPTDLLARMLEHLIAGLSIQTQHFYAIYLTAHGVLKLTVVLLLARRLPWAYPVGMVVLAGFVAYQMQHFALEGGVGLLILSLFDTAMIALIAWEYRQMRRI